MHTRTTITRDIFAQVKRLLSEGAYQGTVAEKLGIGLSSVVRIAHCADYDAYKVPPRHRTIKNLPHQPEPVEQTILGVLTRLMIATETMANLMQAEASRKRGLFR